MRAYEFRRCPATAVLVLVNVSVFALSIGEYVQTGRVSKSIIEQYGLIPTAVMLGEKPWTLLTSIFLHANALHLVVNMLFLWTWGRSLEKLMGYRALLGAYLLSAAFVNIASLAMYDFPTFGDSGAISGVIAVKLLAEERLFSWREIASLVIPWFLIQYLFAYWTFEGVGFWLPIAGFAFGILAITEWALLRGEYVQEGSHLSSRR